MKLQEDLVTSKSTWRMENKLRKTQMKEIHTACQWQILNEKSEWYEQGYSFVEKWKIQLKGLFGIM